MRFSEKHFDKLFARRRDSGYDFRCGPMGRKDRQIVRLLEAKGVAGAKCLDIGPGTGRWLTYLRQMNAAELTAADISSESLRRCRGLADRTLKVDIETEKLAVASDYFDIVIAIEVLEHLVNPELFFSEIKRVCKQDGLVVISTPNICSLISRIRMLFGVLPTAIAADPTHVRFYRQKDIRKLLAAFELVPVFSPTSISINPFKPKSRLQLPSNRMLSGLDDSLLFIVKPAGKSGASTPEMLPPARRSDRR